MRRPWLPLAITLLALLGGSARAAGDAPAFFTQLALLLVVSAGVAYVCQRIGLLPIVGFLLAGVLAGPGALGLVSDPELIDSAAEVGVVLLLFTIGIEFSLEKLARIQRLIFVGGGLQVGLSVALVALLALAFGVRLPEGIFTGCLIALSSTAVVMKLLADRARTRSATGQAALGILIFQDLAVVVMVLLIPLLGGQGGSPLDLVWALGKAALLVTGVLLVARRVMPRLLEAVARTCSQEVFLLTVVAVCFGTAYLTSLAGVSLSLGAFLAGLLVSESRFGRQALSEIMPLQILFSAAFFVSVGLLLDLGYLARNLPLVLGFIAAVLAVKGLTGTLAVRWLGYPVGISAATGLLLAQIGEFSFVLERAGREVGLSPLGLGAGGTQAFVAVTVLLLALTPLLAGAGERLEAARARSEPPRPVAPAAAQEGTHGGAELEGHVLIAGYGHNATHIASGLDLAGVRYRVLTLSPGGAQEAEALGRPVLRGDYTRNLILEEAGIVRARSLVVADDEPETAARTVLSARLLNKDLFIVARIAGEEHADALLRAGADAALSAERAGTLAALTELLRHHGLSDPEAARTAAQVFAPRESQRARIRLTEEQLASERCNHTAVTRAVLPEADGVCPECVALGDTWVHLRVCMTCGHVGCCDSSKNRHASAHFHASGHPVMRSLEPGEHWAWCYIDQQEL
ncbi:CPA2 family monovalent cation:H+ antiporter-2 [Deinobacterium chartae]|uniref:CPA2 family monovalent cation:H+ antiporter-2 n=1 Tax=Deinobacterium chartae TaxID=521158 RepID=A0A841HV80_9DEIO|nr:cation:proton antiporter [Deinobacterium chartae]MBB6096826.1 CPA2 family monovalent cation:H+ antiporter-2 [Deinobacterium chartae]